jgi:hypothetical protein
MILTLVRSSRIETVKGSRRRSEGYGAPENTFKNTFMADHAKTGMLGAHLEAAPHCLSFVAQLFE